MSIEDGRTLLRKLKVNGEDDQLNKLVKDWDGHALTLSLLAGLLVDQFGGDIQHISDLPAPTSDEPRYDRVRRVLERYDKNLSEAERAFLRLFSVFRLPVEERSFSKVFRKKWADNSINSPLVSLTDVEFYRVIGRLVDRRILRGDYYYDNFVFTAHPLIRNHYFTLFTKADSDQGKDAHLKIKDYYLSIAGNTPQYPTLDDLKPLIEVVHHACQAGAYDEAIDVFTDRIYGNQMIIYHVVGAYETALNIFYEFFLDNLEQLPMTSNPDTQRFILSNLGFCLKNLGRLREAVSFNERANVIEMTQQDWENASITYQNLVDLHSQLGTLEASVDAARQALELARRAEIKKDEMVSLGLQGLAENLLGNFESSGKSFEQAELIFKEIYKSKYLQSNIGIHHADHLRRTGDLDYARRVTEANLQILERLHAPHQISQCHRVFGDLDSDSGNYESARAHYESALKIARSIQRRDVLIEALLACGRFYAKTNVGAGLSRQDNARPDSGDPPLQDAFNDLNEALNYAVEGGYRIYEADIRVALAWAYLADLTPSPSPARRGELLAKAKESAERALQMSQEMGYHWGKVDAEEVMQRMKDE